MGCRTSVGRNCRTRSYGWRERYLIRWRPGLAILAAGRPGPRRDAFSNHQKEIYRAVGDRRVGDLITRLKNDGYGGKPKLVELITGIPGSSAWQRRVVLMGLGPMTAKQFEKASATLGWSSAELSRRLDREWMLQGTARETGPHDI